MMKMMMCALLSAALLLLLPGTLSSANNKVPIVVVVENSLLGTSPLTYKTDVAYRGILLGAMITLNRTDPHFNFTYKNTTDYGPYLESVNGVAGNVMDHTYWKLQVKKADGKIITPDVGIGCYIPTENEHIILKFTKW